MRILLIRHGESENNVRSYSSSKLGESLPDPGLSEKGILQANAVGKYLSSQNLMVPRIFSSPLKRTIHTSKIINSYLNTKIEVVVKLHEIAGLLKPDYKGQPNSWYKEQDVIFNEKEIKEEGWYYLDGVENLLQGRKRAEDLIQFIIEKSKSYNQDEVLIIVSHGGTLHNILSILTDQKADSEKFFVHENCGVTCLELGQKLMTSYINNHEFLKGETNLTTDFKNLVKPYHIVYQKLKAMEETKL